MRNLLLISLLATTMATPVLAQDRGDHRRGPRAEQSDTDSSTGDRGSRRSEHSSSRQSDDDNSSSSPQPAPQSPPNRDRPVMRERPQENVQQSGDSVRNWRGRDNDTVVAPTAPAAGDSVRNWRGRDRRPDSPSAIQDRNLGTATPDVDHRTIEERNLRRVRGGVMDRDVRTTPGIGGRVRRIGNNVPAEGTAPPPVSTDVARRGETSRRWSRNWHRDGRYDWRRHRDRHRSRFHLSFYFDPFGWNYRRYNVGWRLWPSYYSQDYWLDDPWQYRLPPAYGPYRWIRYYDDALLVNIYTGTVVDVIHNFFW